MRNNLSFILTIVSCGSLLCSDCEENHLLIHGFKANVVVLTHAPGHSLYATSKKM